MVSMNKEDAAESIKTNRQLSIWQASKKGDVKQIEFLLEKKDVDVDSPNSEFYDETPLHYACVGNQLEAAMVLLEHGANVNVVSKLDGRTPLHYAAKHGNMELVEALLVRDADPNAEDRHKATPYVIAHTEGHMDVAKALIAGEEEADAKKSRREGRSAWTVVLLALLAILVQIWIMYDGQPRRQ